ncbi:hypothetical protein [Sulfurisphaera tokodaii]|uniref:Uncharacterized protein n=2 Tax=Sulfurisphaera tokodaii TaxID=111955 RepID=Q96ZF3_SULTO|nr:hypothetical protein [Sulfurisphaera tokodaii]BAB66972.1 hypothetical protein STK_18800 [Sulfurisphaera tokodaii str. 7]HII75373.1 hypothetical protein [Sulfurisphaera tokodaii]
MSSLEEYLKKKGFQLVNDGKTEKIIMDDYEFYIENNSIRLPIPLPTGKESLDDLVSMGIKYARASRISQGLGAPLEYEISGNVLFIIKTFNDRKDLEEKLIKALEGIESLRYFL